MSESTLLLLRHEILMMGGLLLCAQSNELGS
jgi:hypothetical protein